MWEKCYACGLHNTAVGWPRTILLKPTNTDTIFWTPSQERNKLIALAKPKAGENQQKQTLLDVKATGGIDIANNSKVSTNTILNLKNRKPSQFIPRPMTKAALAILKRIVGTLPAQNDETVEKQEHESQREHVFDNLENKQQQTQNTPIWFCLSRASNKGVPDASRTKFSLLSS